MPVIEHSSPPLFEFSDPVLVVESVPPAVELPSSPSSGQSSYVSSRTLAWCGLCVQYVLSSRRRKGQYRGLNERIAQTVE